MPNMKYENKVIAELFVWIACGRAHFLDLYLHLSISYGLPCVCCTGYCFPPKCIKASPRCWTCLPLSLCLQMRLLCCSTGRTVVSVDLSQPAVLSVCPEDICSNTIFTSQRSSDCSTSICRLHSLQPTIYHPMQSCKNLV